MNFIPCRAVAEAEKRWTMKTRNWPEIMAQLSIFFQDRFQGPLCNKGKPKPPAA